MVSGLEKHSSGTRRPLSAVGVASRCVYLPCFCTVLTKEGDLRVEQLVKTGCHETSS